jgi:hypothetical protein
VATEAILNLVWALLCIGALSRHFWRDRHRTDSEGGVMRWRRAVSVLLAAVALFPVISASDDRLRLADICTAGPPWSVALDRGQVQDPPSAPLEDPEHGQIAEGLPLFTFLVSFFAVAPHKAPIQARWFAGRASGRAPPLFPAQA